MKKYFKYLLPVVLAVVLIMPIAAKAATSAEIQAQINAIMEQIKQLQAQLAQLQSQKPVQCFDWNLANNLKIGSSGPQVSSLHSALIRDGEISGWAAVSEGVFDEVTASAVSGFQQKYKDEILTPLGLKYGTGYVGKATRTKLNKLYGCGVTTGNQPPVISGVSGPTALKVNETGTWTVSASDPEQGALSYSVVWGDEVTTGATSQGYAPSVYIQIATFTHSYAWAGVYYPTFKVTDNSGLSAKTSISVNVGDTVVAKGSFYLYPDGLNITVGKSAEIQAWYQPPMPLCPAGVYCAQVMPPAYPVEAKWVSSNPAVALIDYKVTGIAQFGFVYDYKTAVVRGVSTGTAEIKATYTESSGNVLIAAAKVEITPSTQPSITTTSLSSGTVGTAYNSYVSATGGSGSYRWSATGLPAGLSIESPVCGEISIALCNTTPAGIYGTPTTAGTYTVNITLTSGTQSVSKRFSLVIAAAGALVPSGQYSASMLENIKVSLDQIQKAINDLYR